MAASSDLLTRRISHISLVGATVTAVASAGSVATAFHGLTVNASPSKMRVATLESNATMVYLASAATLISQSRTDVAVGHVTLRGSSTRTVLSAAGVITTAFPWASSSEDEDGDKIRWKGQDRVDEFEPDELSDEEVLCR